MYINANVLGSIVETVIFFEQKLFLISQSKFYNSILFYTFMLQILTVQHSHLGLV